jgi:hypothetical protein
MRIATPISYRPLRRPTSSPALTRLAHRVPVAAWPAFIQEQHS